MYVRARKVFELCKSVNFIEVKSTNLATNTSPPKNFIHVEFPLSTRP